MKQLLQWGEAWLQLLLQQPCEPQLTVPTIISSTCNPILQTCLLAPSYAACLQTLVAELAREFQSERVAVGSFQQGDVKLQAVSNRARFDPRSERIRLLEHTMAQAAKSGATVYAAVESDVHDAGNVAAQPLTQTKQKQTQCCLVLKQGSLVSNVLLLERLDGRAFSKKEKCQLEQLSVLLTPLLVMKQTQQRSLLGHAKETFASKLAPAADTPGRGRRYAILALLVIALVFLLMPGQYRISATAELEGKVQRAVL